jgi:hypothetical protein
MERFNVIQCEVVRVPAVMARSHREDHVRFLWAYLAGCPVLCSTLVRMLSGVVHLLAGGISPAVGTLVLSTVPSTLL